MSEEELALVLVSRMKNSGFSDQDKSGWATIELIELARWLIKSGHVTGQTMLENELQR